MAHIQDNHGSLYGTILNTERRLEELWLASRRGKIPLINSKGF
jgi:hypothetical protein